MGTAEHPDTVDWAEFLSSLWAALRRENGVGVVPRRPEGRYDAGRFMALDIERLAQARRVQLPYFLHASMPDLATEIGRDLDMRQSDTYGPMRLRAVRTAKRRRCYATDGWRLYADDGPFAG